MALSSKPKCCLATLLVVQISLLSGCRQSPESRSASFLEAGQKHYEKQDYTRALLNYYNAIEATPNAPEPYYRAALAFLATGDTHDAAVQLEKALAKDPRHLPSQIKLCELMLVDPSREATTEAQSRLVQVLNASPDNSDALIAIALAEWKLEKPDQAERYLRRALEVSPQDVKPLVALTRIKLGQNDLAGAEAVLQAAAKREPVSANALVAYGEFLLLSGRLDDAEALLQKAIVIDPKNVLAVLDLAALKHRVGKTSDAEQLYRRASVLDKRYLTVYSDYLLATGRQQEALRELEKVHSDHPDDQRARDNLVATYVGTARFADAEQVVNAAIEQNPDDYGGLLRRAELRVIRNDLKGALTDVNRVIAAQPRSGEAQYVLAQIQAQQGSSMLAVKALQDALQYNPTLLAARLRLVEMMLGSGDFAGAMRVLDAAPEHQRGTREVLEMRNQVLIALGDDAGARRSVDHALARFRSPVLIKQKALLELKSREYAQAQRTVELLLATTPDDLQALDILVRSYLARDQAALAVQRVRQFAEANPKSAPMHWLLGRLLVITGQRSSGREEFRAAIQADPRYMPARLALAEMDAREGKLDAASEELREAMAIEPRNTGARLFLAQIESAGNRLPEAIAELRKALQTEPSNVMVLNNLAFWLAESNQCDEALKYAEKAKELSPDQPAVADTIGWVLYRKGMYQMAVKHLEDAVAKQPTVGRRAHLAMAYYKMGDQSKSEEMLRAALRLDPNSPDARAAQSLILPGQAKP